MRPSIVRRLPDLLVEREVSDTHSLKKSAEETIAVLRNEIESCKTTITAIQKAVRDEDWDMLLGLGAVPYDEFVAAHAESVKCLTALQKMLTERR